MNGIATITEILEVVSDKLLQYDFKEIIPKKQNPLKLSMSGEGHSNAPSPILDSISLYFLDPQSVAG